ncbi:MAG: amidohydrolase family protein [Solobacterium sp.]|nr:amidohydrolase family protein [Solobacterium sp.]
MILRNCRLIPELCEGYKNDTADIRVEGDTIAEFLPAGGVYPDEDVVECDGFTVLPGLFNTHVHIMWDIQSVKNRKSFYSEYDFILSAIRYMKTLVAYGYTSLRDCGTPYNIAIKLRDSINAGEIKGPDIKACGIIMTPSQRGRKATSHSSSYGMCYNDPFSLRDGARRQISDGADFLKILGCAMAVGTRPDKPLFYPDEIESLMQVVEYEGTYLSVHCFGENAINSAVDAGARVIDHALLLTPGNVEKMLARKERPLIAATYSVCDVWGEEAVRKQCTGLNMALDAGLLVGWGTDVAEDFFLTNPAREFQLREKFMNVSRIEILKQATINSAVISQTENQRGSLKVGKKADFAVIDGRPDEDFACLAKPCEYVFKDGELLARKGQIVF